MANLDNAEKIARKTLYSIGYDYLCNNFHKFNEANKIKVAISVLNIFEKDDSKSKQDLKQIVVMNDVVKNGTPLRYNLGHALAPGDIENSGQARSNPDETG